VNVVQCIRSTPSVFSDISEFQFNWFLYIYPLYNFTNCANW